MDIKRTYMGNESLVWLYYGEHTFVGTHFRIVGPEKIV